MKCSDVRQRLSAFQDGDAPSGEMTAIRQHLAGCADCAAAAAKLRELVGALSKLERHLEPDTDLWPGIAARLGENEGQETVSSAGVPWHRWRDRLAAWLGLGRGIGALAWRGSLATAVIVGLVLLRDHVEQAAPADPAWQVTRLEGAPVLGAQDLTTPSTLQPGVWLRTDSASRARLTALDVGRVDVGPASEMRVLEANAKEHRIELAQGALRAFIWAPPRLFFVETPAGVAEDLGCEYDLVVDRGGNGELAVTLGFVSFERDGREVIVPDGARCELRAGLGPGTPHASGASKALREALQRLDSTAPAEAAALEAVLDTAGPDDAVTLWHLLPRTEDSDRARVLERLAALVPPPEGVTREGALALDAGMLDSWWAAIYPDWNLWQR